MKRLPAVICLIMILFFLTACQVHMNLWINNDGSGSGTISLIDVPTSDSSAQKEQMQKQGYEIVSVKTGEKNKITYNVKWKDFNQPFVSRKENNDGTITLDFGETGQISGSSIKVHLMGKIIKTTGEAKPGNAVYFVSGTGKRATVTYRPSSVNAIVIVVTFAICAALAFYVVAQATKNRNGNDEIDESLEDFGEIK